MSTFYKLRIKQIVKETIDAISITFDVPKELATTYKFVAGQYLTIKLTLDGNEIRRAYSICSSPQSGDLTIAIKGIFGGVFSNFAVNQLKENQYLEVSIPEGRFIFEPKSAAKNTYVAFAAGSGITPIMSIMQSVLEEEPNSSFVLVYGNKSVQSTIFYQKINQLKEKYLGRLHVHYVFSQEQCDGELFGRIDKSVVNLIVKNKYNYINFEKFYLCGPNQMVIQVTDVLKENGVQSDKIKFELFTTAASKEDNKQVATDGQYLLHVLLDGEETSFSVPNGTTLLDAILKKGLDPAYSCLGGICSSCIARITKGNAQMKKNSILTDDEIEEGLILSCQAVPTTSEISVNFDDV
ncbi:MAG: ferredoxin--NADP reductase [Bacteroidota bacterium]|nr:ferredoxin--NADP reductase [Bacteroidota bacterium]